MPGGAGLSALIVSVYVRPGGREPSIGGSHDGALIVKVTERAVDGRATAAVLSAVAAAFGVPRAAVTLRSGAGSRRKVLLVDGGNPAVLAALLAGLTSPSS